jgi:photosystem II stability/assembly factor-like uncharacterized protein
MKRLFTSFASLFCVFSLTTQAQWATQTLGNASPRAVQQISIVNSSTAWVVSEDAANPLLPVKDVFKTTNSGAAWQKSIVTASNLTVGSVYGLDANRAWACMLNAADTGGSVFATTDGGATWKSQDSAVFHVNPKIVYFWDADSGVCIGNPYEEHFEIYTTKDGGNDWEVVKPLDMPACFDNDQTFGNSYWTKGDTIWFGGYTNGRIFVSYDRGYHWSFIPVPCNKVPIVFFRDTVGFAGNNDFINDDNEFYTTLDNGLHWEKVGCEGLIGCYSITYVKGTPGTLVSVGQGMMLSNDWGETWVAMQNPTTFPSALYSEVAFFNLTSGWAGGENLNNPGNGGIYKYSGPALNINNTSNQTIRPEVFPNPASGSVTIAINNPRSQNAVFEMRDISGRLVISQAFFTEGGFSQKLIDLGDIKPGLYLTKLQLKNTVYTNKLIVK